VTKFAVKVLVTFALEAEFAPWRKMRAFRRERWGAVNAHVAEIGGAEVGVLLTGVGPKQAAFAASKAIEAQGDSLKFCVSSGFAGALRPDYTIGRVLAARGVFSEKVHGDFQGRAVECSAPLVSFAAELGATVVDGFYTAARVIVRAEEKRHLAHTADAVEMESFEVLRQAATCAIPAVAIRAISDTSGEEFPLDMNRIFDDQGKVSIPRVMGQVARHPRALPGLVRLGQRSRRAAESLTKFLDRYVAFVAERARNLESQLTATVQ
jgi:nucleoside phosphorylase